jgi:thioredoxin reductase (NADPH)
MSPTTPPPPVDDPAAFPTLTAAQIDRIGPYGRIDDVAAGAFVFEEGQVAYDFVVILDGSVDVLRRGQEGRDAVIASHGAGRFLGELSLLTQQRTVLAARAATDARILRVTPERFRALMAAETEISDIVFAALVARREVMRAGAASTVLRIIGSRYSANSLELRSFARRQRLPHTWIDLDGDDVDDVDVLLASVGARRHDVPVVVTPTAVLRRPTVGELAAHLGLAHRHVDGRVYDLVVVGAGPAGLAAAVYGASEGLDTLAVDAIGPGGQAGTSSRIENFFGFPAGVSGGELVERGALQATRLGAEVASPCRVTSLAPHDQGFTLGLQDGTPVQTRAVIVAVGVQYRKLPLARLEEFEGAGVYYAATELEAQLCSAEPVVVIGGGNSAGQAAVYLAQRGSDVTVVIRGESLEASMSRYLIDRIDASPAIRVRNRTNVTALHGDQRLRAVTLTTAAPDGTTDEVVDCAGMFSFIGAVPHTGWLPAGVELDEKGFVRTDRDVIETAAAGVDLLPFETSLPGVFAVGDVRVGSMKRVAAAVGEGSSAVRSVHQHLARP